LTRFALQAPLNYAVGSDVGAGAYEKGFAGAVMAST
jgi:hypothetical protein